MLLVSDIHFGANREQDVRAFLNRALSEELNPDKIVIIAGDITQTASDGQFYKAEFLIKELLKAGIKLVFTPGNHDFGDWIGEHIKTNKRARSWCNILLSPIFSQKEVVAHHQFDSIYQFERDIFLALRSTHRGEASKLGLFGSNRITRKQIEWAKSQLLKLDFEGRRLHLVSHRSLWHESGDMHSGMIKRRRLEENLIKHFPFYSFIHGHNHRFVFSNTSTPKLAIPIFRLGLPTLSVRNKKWKAGFVSWEYPNGKSPVLIPCID